MERFRITIASLPDRENLVAEITCDGIEWAEISQETDQMIVQIYPNPQQELWEFPIDEALLALENAKQRLLKMGGFRS